MATDHETPNEGAPQTPDATPEATPQTGAQRPHERVLDRLKAFAAQARRGQVPGLAAAAVVIAAFGGGI
ncbi:hypothetical protein, partial [Phenylobacterium conjunctum]